MESFTQPRVGIKLITLLSGMAPNHQQGMSSIPTVAMPTITQR